MGTNATRKRKTSSPKINVKDKERRNTPSPKVNLKDKRRIFEDNLANKYRNQRNAKEMAREKSKMKKDRRKKETPEKEDSIAMLLREMRDDIKEIKSNSKDIKKNMQEMNTKIVSIENKQKENESKTVIELEEIRNEMQANNATMQETIATNVLNQLQPIITERQNTIDADDVK